VDLFYQVCKISLEPEDKDEMIKLLKEKLEPFPESVRTFFSQNEKNGFVTGVGITYSVVEVSTDGESFVPICLVGSRKISGKVNGDEDVFIYPVFVNENAAVSIKDAFAFGKMMSGMSVGLLAHVVPFTGKTVYALTLEKLTSRTVEKFLSMGFPHVLDEKKYGIDEVALDYVKKKLHFKLPEVTQRRVQPLEVEKVVTDGNSFVLRKNVDVDVYVALKPLLFQEDVERVEKVHEDLVAEAQKACEKVRFGKNA